MNEAALLALRDDLLRLARTDPDQARAKLRDVALPELKASPEAGPGVWCTFEFLEATLALNPDDAFATAIENAVTNDFGALVAHGFVEWANHCERAGRHEDADRHFEKAQQKFRELERGDDAERLFLSRARTARAALPWREAAARLRGWLADCPRPDVAARLGIELAGCALHADDARAADEELRRAADLVAGRDPVGEELVRAARGQWYWQLGGNARALELFADAERALLELGERSEATAVAANRASLCVSMERELDAAVCILEDLRSGATDLPVDADPLLYWQISISLASAYEKLGRFDRASDVYADLDTTPIARPWERKLAGLNFAHLRVRAGVDHGLEADLAAAVEDPVVCEEPFLRFLALENLGSFCRSRGRDTEACGFFEDALTTLEQSRTTLPWEFLRRQLREAKRHAFDVLETTLLALGRVEEAWCTNDRGRAQSFADFLGDSFPALEPGAAAAHAKARTALANAYRDANADAVEAAERLFDRSLGEAPRAFSKQLPPRSWTEWPALRRDDVALVHFTSGPKPGGVYTVRGGKVAFQALSVPREKLDAEISTWWRSQRTARRDLAATDTDAWHTTTSRWCAELFGDLGLEGVTRLLIVPDGALALLPWAGLWDGEGETYLADRFPGGLSVIPGARVGQRLAERRGHAEAADRSLVVRPDAGLAFASLEVRSVVEALGAGAKLLEGTLATTAALTQALRHSAWLHFAGHGIYRDDLPLASYLALGEDRFTGWDMLVSPFPATTVVLSACEVGSVREMEKGEWLGLLRGFFLAGCRSVVASPFEVLDLASVATMQSFYRALASEHGELDRALHLAQTEVRAIGKWALASFPAEHLVALDSGQLAWEDELAHTDGAGATLLRELMKCERSRSRFHENPLQRSRRVAKIARELQQLAQPRHWSTYQVYGAFERG